MRDETIRVRVTAEQAAQIDAARIGEETRSQTVRRLLFDAVQTLAVEPISATPAPTMAQTAPSVTRVAGPSPAVAAAPISGAGHPHRRGAVIKTEWVRGVQVKTYACVVEDCPATLGGS